jgi:hypothetical protein
MTANGRQNDSHMSKESVMNLPHIHPIYSTGWLFGVGALAGLLAGTASLLLK